VVPSKNEVTGPKLSIIDEFIKQKFVLLSTIVPIISYLPLTTLGTRIDQMGNPFGHISIWSSS
jgi:hypothetical protein